jgi:hypothetical protein
MFRLIKVDLFQKINFFTKDFNGGFKMTSKYKRATENVDFYLEHSLSYS